MVKTAAENIAETRAKVDEVLEEGKRHWMALQYGLPGAAGGGVGGMTTGNPAVGAAGAVVGGAAGAYVGYRTGRQLDLADARQKYPVGSKAMIYLGRGLLPDKVTVRSHNEKTGKSSVSFWDGQVLDVGTLRLKPIPKTPPGIKADSRVRD